MSTGPAPSSPAPATPAKKTRSPGEKLLVRGGIILLLVLAALQAHARFGYGLTLQKLQTKVAEEDTTGNPLLVSELPGMIVGWPSKSEETDRRWKKVVYSWRGLTQSYEIRMVYDTSDDNPAVMSLETADAPEPEPLPAPTGDDASVADTSNAPTMPMGGGPSGGPPGAHSGPGSGGPGGGARPNIMDSDADGDGKVSKAEAPERIAETFGQIDTNGDEFIDAEEADAYRARRRAEREAAGGPGGAEGRPRATDAPATDSTEKPADAPAAATSPANEKP